MKGSLYFNTRWNVGVIYRIRVKFTRPCVGRWGQQMIILYSFLNWSFLRYLLYCRVNEKQCEDTKTKKISIMYPMREHPNGRQPLITAYGTLDTDRHLWVRPCSLTICRGKYRHYAIKSRRPTIIPLDYVHQETISENYPNSREAAIHLRKP